MLLYIYGKYYMKIIISILIFFLLSVNVGKACPHFTQQWVNPQGTNAGVKTISFMCLSEASSKVPQFFCKDVMACTWVEYVQIARHTSMYETCMYQNGLRTKLNM
jgi:hypothetical protein